MKKTHEEGIVERKSVISTVITEVNFRIQEI